MSTQIESPDRSDWQTRRLAPLEVASRQLISFQDLKNVDKNLLRALYQIDITTVDTFMSTSTTDLLVKLAANDDDEACDACDAIAQFKAWRQQVQMLWNMRVKKPLPTQWGAF